MMHVAIVSMGDSAGDNLASKMRLAAQNKGVEMEIKSIAANNLGALEKAQVVWLAPNARYEEERVSKWCTEHKAKYAIIDPLTFSTMNGDLLVDKTVELAE